MTGSNADPVATADEEWPPAGEWQQALRDVAAEAEARGREQGRREQIERLRAEAERRERDALGEWMEFGDRPLRVAADFLEYIEGPE